MSSTYAVRKTDEYEKAFMQELDKDTKLEYRRKSGSLGANASLLLLQLKNIRNKALQIVNDETHLGEEIPSAFGRELKELTTTFHAMSMRLRSSRDLLEQRVRARTAELTGLPPSFQSATGTASAKCLREASPIYGRLAMSIPWPQRTGVSARSNGTTLP
jgi:hypothetical protein